MKLHNVIGLVVVLLLAFYVDVCAAVEVQTDNDNVVGSKIEGAWEVDEELMRRVEGFSLGIVTFKSDANIASKVPVKYDEFLKGKRVYLAGLMTLRNQEYPFILIEHKGNPCVVYFWKRGDDPFGHAESLNVMLAVAKETSKDLLFIGGDFNNQPFSAYRRIAAPGK